MTADLILALDQGTTSTRAVIFDQEGGVQASHAIPLQQYFPKPGWVEHDPREIWQAALSCARAVIEQAGIERIACMGISNQRETTVLWDRTTGEPLHRAIVWQDRRTADLCSTLVKEGWGEKVRDRTGLVLDPYFSATKLAWLLKTLPGARAKAQDGALCCGTIESWLVWNLTSGARHISDATNAARTLIYDISRQTWDDELLERLEIPSLILPEIVDVAGELGQTDPQHFSRSIPITGLAGDQQAAAIGQACFTSGATKATYGTGCFVLANTGAQKIRSDHRLLSTTAYRVGQIHDFALEGSIFMAGAILQWLRDQLGLFDDVKEVEEMARKADPHSGVVLVPAFTGLGAPHWAPETRAALFGLTRGAGRSEVVRAALEAVAFQTNDLMRAITNDLDQNAIRPPGVLRIDGGMARNDWFVQFLSDVLDMPVERARNTEATALGAAYLAGHGAGLYRSFDDIAAQWRADIRFEPKMSNGERDRRLDEWRQALSKLLNSSKNR